MTKYIHAESANNKLTVFHTDKDCQTLKGRVRPVTESEIEYHELTLCQWCDPETESPNAQYEQDFSYQEALKEAAENNE
jgi:predicted secreted Zn-dependent protease